MPEITAYLSPNGGSHTRGAGPATTLKVATIKGIATLKRASASAPWKLDSTTLENLHIGSILFEPKSGKLFAGAHENQGLWVSDDGEGKSWRQITGSGLDKAHVYALDRREANGKVTLYLGTQPVGIFRSEDLGETWTELKSIHDVPEKDKWTFPGPPHIPHIKCFTIHPTEPETFFALVEQGGLFKTSDEGKTWRELKDYSKEGDRAYRDLHRLLIDDKDPSKMFLATGEGVYRSEDGGEHFTHLIKRGEIMDYPDDLFFDPDNHDIVYAAGTHKSPFMWMQTNRADGLVFRTTDRGDTWTELTNGLPKPVNVAYEAMGQHAYPGGFMLVIGGADGRVWTSEDRGNSWTQVEGKLAPISKDHHYLPFLSSEERPQWLQRREERTGHKIKFGPPPGAGGGGPPGGGPPGAGGPPGGAPPSGH